MQAVQTRPEQLAAEAVVVEAIPHGSVRSWSPEAEIGMRVEDIWDWHARSWWPLRTDGARWHRASSRLPVCSLAHRAGPPARLRAAAPRWAATSPMRRHLACAPPPRAGPPARLRVRRRKRRGSGVGPMDKRGIGGC
jgi:hypothetical protein